MASKLFNAIAEMCGHIRGHDVDSAGTFELELATCSAIALYVWNQRARGRQQLQFLRVDRWRRWRRCGRDWATRAPIAIRVASNRPSNGIFNSLAADGRTPFIGVCV